MIQVEPGTLRKDSGEEEDTQRRSLRKITFYSLNKFQGIKVFDYFSSLKNSPPVKRPGECGTASDFHEASMKQMHKNVIKFQNNGDKS